MTLRLGCIADALQRSGHGYASVDAVADEDLLALGAACEQLPLLTGGSGIAMGEPANLGFRKGAAEGIPALGGQAAVLSGSRSAQSNAQVAELRAKFPAG